MTLAPPITLPCTSFSLVSINIVLTTSLMENGRRHFPPKCKILRLSAKTFPPIFSSGFPVKSTRHRFLLNIYSYDILLSRTIRHYKCGIFYNIYNWLFTNPQESAWSTRKPGSFEEKLSERSGLPLSESALTVGTSSRNSSSATSYPLKSNTRYPKSTRIYSDIGVAVPLLQTTFVLNYEWY